jgi:hypothetical protein
VKYFNKYGLNFVKIREQKYKFGDAKPHLPLHCTDFERANNSLLRRWTLSNPISTHRSASINLICKTLSSQSQTHRQSLIQHWPQVCLRTWHVTYDLVSSKLTQCQILWEEVNMVRFKETECIIMIFKSVTFTNFLQAAFYG